MNDLFNIKDYVVVITGGIGVLGLIIRHRYSGSRRWQIQYFRHVVGARLVK